MKTILLIVTTIIVVVIVIAWQLSTVYKSNQSTNLHRNQKIANPASTYCAENGGKNVIITLQNGAQDGICQFANDLACEEWAMMRGECPLGGVKTVGYNNEGQKYCAWLGGKTVAEPNSQCTLPNGNTCSTDALYAGTCGE